ncbi:arginine--tRNA ligase [Candidatus Collierbacteria bacterium]|nr:arginine--tRNA ligase [Candidatus Collierbacteria bacterium]
MKFTIDKAIKTAIQKTLKDLGFPETQVSLEHPAVEVHGDYSSNIALTLFPSLRSASRRSGNLKFSSPRQLAESIVDELSSNKELKKIVSKIEVASPGFINFILNEKLLIIGLEEILKEKNGYGSSNSAKGKTMVIDYSAPNIAKRFTIGHLRSTIIGQAIYNIYKFLGWKCIGDNHLGDWGTQFGKMIVAIRKWAGKSVDELTIDEMESLYVRFHQEAETNKELDEEARVAFKALEDGKKEERELWKKLVIRSMEEFQKIYDLLGVKIDEVYGESYYESMMPPIIDEAKKKGVAIESKGALIIPYPKDALPPSMLLKSDGGTTYLTRDLATIKFRKEKWNPDLMIYEVGSEQTLHFRQVFLAVELLGWAKRNQFFHIPHGLIRLKEGKISTRKGNAVKLEQVLTEAIDRAKKFNDDPEISKMVGIGAVKYNDLKHSPSTGYVFDWAEMINLDGNSGPYLQYTHARCRSVLNKAGVFPSSFFPLPSSLNFEELSILRFIYRFPEVVMEAAKQYAPNLVCTFLYELAQRFNTFYNKHRILGDNAQRSTFNAQLVFRLLLTSSVAQVLKNGLALLGIQSPNAM